MAKRKAKPEPVKEPKAVAKPVEKVSGPKWVKVTPEELNKFQAEGKLKGYKPSTGEALV